MSGRPYTMQEMKGIVDYIVERRLYSDFKGRKMWQDYASSNMSTRTWQSLKKHLYSASSLMTTRTWQSLKETFIKRILPDITNSFYNLDVVEIRSFRCGYDVKTKGEDNKLEFRSSSSIRRPSKNEMQHNGNVISGEQQTSQIVSKRESIDTIVLGTDKCYEIIENEDQEIDEKFDVTEPSPPSIIDCITYSEPLTPMLQEIMHDFDSDEEPSLEIIEDGIDVEPETQIPLEATENKAKQEENSSKENINTQNCTDEKTSKKSNKNPVKKTTAKKTKAISDYEQNYSKDEKTKKKKQQPETVKNKLPVNESKRNSEDSFNTSSVIATAGSTLGSLPDTLLPNNQEEISEGLPKSNRRSSVEQTPQTTDTRKSTETLLFDKPKTKSIKKKSSASDSYISKTKKNKSKKSPNIVKDETESWNSHKYNTQNVYSVTHKNKEQPTDDTINLEQHEQNSNDDFAKTPTDDEKDTDSENISNKVKKSNASKLNHATEKEAGTSWSIRENQTEGLKLILEKQQVSPPTLESQSIIQDINEYNQAIPLKSTPTTQAECFNSTPDKQDGTPSFISDNPAEPTKSDKNHQPEPSESKQDNQQEKLKADVLNQPGTSKPTADNQSSVFLPENSHMITKSTISPALDIKDTDNCTRPGSSKPADIEEISDSPTDESGKPRKRKMCALLNDLFSNTKDGSNRKRNKRRCYDKDDSSSWTSDSDGDIFDQIPSRRRRGNSKYIKSNKILVDEDGNAFFAVGSRLAPLKHQPVDDTSQDFWKQKFLEEQNKNADLIKLLNKISESNNYNTNALPASSPVLVPKTSTTRPPTVPEVESSEFVTEGQHQNGDTPKTKTVSIKFAKDNQEIKIEGDWQNLHSIIPEIMQTFQKTVQQPPVVSNNEKDKKISEKEQQNGNKTKNKVDKENQNKSNAQNKSQEVDKNKTNDNKNQEKEQESDHESAISLASDEEVHEKINKLEDEIQKEILKIESSPRKSRKKSSESVISISSSVNVNPRTKRGRPKKLRSVEPQLSQSIVEPKSKRLRANVSDGELRPKKLRSVEPQLSQSIVEPKSKRLRANVSDGELNISRSKKKSVGVPEAVSRDNSRKRASNKKPTAPKKASPAKKPDDDARDGFNAEQDDDSDGIRYKFPSPILQKLKKNSLNNRLKKQVVKKSLSTFSLIPEQSMESTQGYLDTDSSSFTVINLRRKKKLTLATKPNKGRLSRNFRKKVSNFYMDDTSESSNSCFNIPPIQINGKTRRSSSVNSSRYKSESYQLLMAQRKEINRLETLVEKTNTVADTNNDLMLNLSPASQNLEGELVHSSSVSLPLSPELSIVENISIEKSCLQNICDPTLNEMQMMENSEELIDIAFLTGVDASLPLMEQESHLTVNQKDTEEITDVTMNECTKVNEPNTTNSMTINEIKSQDTISESFHIKLSNMLLESAKKITRNEINKENFLIDNNEKNKTKKRCSTPRKKKGPTKLLLMPQRVDSVIEEQIEYCTSGRKSCPPKLCSDIVIQENSITLPDSTFTGKPKKSRIKKPKEVLKVKITRPKRSRSRLSIMADSGINDVSTLYDEQGSIDLTHNHSETCIANECMSDSFEIIEKSQSIISINSSNSNHDNHQGSSPVFFSAFVKDGSTKSDVMLSISTNAPSSPRTQSIVSPNSLLTEDLSEEETNHARPDWYMYSEEDTNTNINILKPTECSMGSSLRQLFPIVCAVPDLSTITEHTEFNEENSRKNLYNFNSNSETY